MPESLFSFNECAERLRGAEATLMKQTTSLKRLLSVSSEAERQELHNCLQTIYGNIMALQGRAAIASDQANNAAKLASTPQRQAWMDCLCWTLSELLNEIQDLSYAIGDMLPPIVASSSDKDIGTRG